MSSLEPGRAWQVTRPLGPGTFPSASPVLLVLVGRFSPRSAQNPADLAAQIRTMVVSMVYERVCLLFMI